MPRNELTLLLAGLCAALGSLGVLLALPAGSSPRDATWAILLLAAGLCLGWFERNRARRNQPLQQLRWVAAALSLLALAELAWLAAVHM